MNLFPQLPPDVQSFLLLIATVPGAFFSQFEKVQWFSRLTSGQKLVVQVGLSAIAAVLLTVLASPTLPAGTVDKVNTWYLLIVQIANAVIANFATHISVNVIAKPVGKALTAHAENTGPQG